MNELKYKLRKEVLKKRIALTEKEIKEKSLIIKERLFHLKEFKNAELIMFYFNFKNEVATWEMMEEAISLGKKVALPKTSMRGGIKPYLIFNLKEDLVPGLFGIPEPKAGAEKEVNPHEIDMVIVPGIVFDRYGHRVGFGRGFYDRFLRSISPQAGESEATSRPFRVGLGFELQIVDTIPADSYDERVDMVITETRIYEAGL